MITQIEQALLSCNADRFANICRLYLSYKYDIVNSTGFVVGKEKSKKGTPDNFIPYKDFYIFNEITTIDKKQLVPKLKKDIEHCFIQKEISASKIVKIILICNGEITPKIQEELNNYKNSLSTNTDLEIIGIDSFATIIFRDYPQISKELGFPIDTGQILEIEDFIVQYEKSKFATPLSNEFFNREDDLKNANVYLNNTDILLISGQAGVGKTKFSLELVKKYKFSNPECIIKYIKNNGNQSIWDDLKIQLLQSNSYLIVVDDANKLKSNLELILNFKNEFKNDKIKIILTVRNYVKSEVENFLNKFSEIELKNFEKIELNKILQSSSFNITRYYADRIYSISKGNPRIAIMGAIAGKNNDIHKLTNASIILEEYFSSVSENIRNDEDLLKVAGILSLFRVIDISNTLTLDEIEKYFNISKNTLIEKLKTLFDNEIADEYKNTYKIADQILGEYIFYLIFIKEKKLNFKLLIDIHFDDHKFSLMKLLTPIVSNYGFDEIKVMIIDDIKAKWSDIKDVDNALRFLKDFWFYLPSETLIYINSLINPSEDKNYLNYKFEVYKSNYTQSYDDKIIYILINFQQLHDKFEFALEILLKYGLSSEFVFSKLLKVYKQSFVYSQYSYETDYNTQVRLLDLLYSKIDINKAFYSKIILFIAPKFLVDSYNCTSSDVNKMYFGQVPIILTEMHKEFRTKLWMFCFDCYNNLNLRENVYTFFENHKSSYFNNQNKKVLRCSYNYL